MKPTLMGRLSPLLAAVGVRWQFFFKRLLKKGFWAKKKYWPANKKSWHFFFSRMLFFSKKNTIKQSWPMKMTSYLQKLRAYQKIVWPTKYLAVFFYGLKKDFSVNWWVNSVGRVSLANFGFFCWANIGDILSMGSHQKF